MTEPTITLALDYSNRFIDPDGRLHVRTCNLSKANVCGYLGREIPGYEALGLDASRVYNLYRDPDELGRAIASANNLPLLDEHLAATAADPKHDHVVGSTGTDAAFNAPYLQNSLVIWDSGAIAGIESGEQRQLSCAYRYRPDMARPDNPSLTPTCDGVMRDIVFSHVALVEAGRAGPDVLVADSKLEPPSMSKRAERLKTLLAGKLATDGKVDFTAVSGALDEMDVEDKAAKDAEEAEAAKKAEEEKAAADKAARDKAARDKRAKDAKRARDGETDEERDVREAKEAEDARRAKDAEEEEAMKAKEAEDRKANDAAISTAVKSALAARDALDTARTDVRPLVGEVTACDSAEAVYKFALDAMKIDVTGVHPSAYGAILRSQPKAGAAKPIIAMDAAAGSRFDEMFLAGSLIRAA